MLATRWPWRKRVDVSARGGLRRRQMRHAIFLAIARDAKIEIGIGQFGCAANRAFVKRFGLAARVIFKTFPPAGDFVTMPRPINKFGSEENQVNGKGTDQSTSIRHRIRQKSQDKERH